jgi:hypothetical protein
MAIDYAARARALVGTRFRPQGRTDEGLDCVGVVLATFGIPVDDVRRNYRLRGNDVAEIRHQLLRFFRKVPQTQLRAGDVMLLRVAERRLHLAVRTSAGFVHANAGIGRVVETPGNAEWPLIGVYRKRRKF